MTDNTIQYRDKLISLISRTGAFQHSPDKPFRLASGATSPYYFDLRKLCGDPEGISVAAEALYQMILNNGGIDSVGGLESGSIPLATAVSQLSHLKHLEDPSSPQLSSFYVRKNPKTHGAGKLIEGNVGSSVAIIDDVITSGGSAIKAAAAVAESGSKCVCILALVFRGGEDDRKQIGRTGKLDYLFTEDELVVKLAKKS